MSLKTWELMHYHIPKKCSSIVVHLKFESPFLFHSLVLLSSGSLSRSVSFLFLLYPHFHRPCAHVSVLQLWAGEVVVASLLPFNQGKNEELLCMVFTQGNYTYRIVSWTRFLNVCWHGPNTIKACVCSHGVVHTSVYREYKYTYIYIYIYTERKRDIHVYIWTNKHVCACVCIYVYIYIFMYVYTCSLDKSIHKYM